MFWITAATFVAVLCYTYFTYQQIGGANKIYVTQNRPYLVVSSIQNNNQLTAEGNKDGYRITIGFINTGNTPAINMVAHICEPLLKETTLPAVLACTEAQPMMTGSVVGPRQNQSIVGPALSQSDVDVAVNGKAYIFIYGYVTYDDSIGGVGNYVTRFCKRITQTKAAIIDPNLAQVSASLMSNYVEVGCRNQQWECIDKTCKPL